MGLTLRQKALPIVLSVISTVGGLLPACFAQELFFWHNLAMGTIGGLVFSTFWLLLLAPLMLDHAAPNPSANPIAPSPNSS